VFTILRNTFYSGLRKQKHEVADTDGLHAATLVTLPDHDGRLAMGEFLRAFKLLSAEHRAIVTLVGASGYSCIDVSKRAGIPVGTAKSRLRRARVHLTALLEAPKGKPITAGDCAALSPVGIESSTGIKSVHQVCSGSDGGTSLVHGKLNRFRTAHGSPKVAAQPISRTNSP
jgi:RNA polymerase sigma-70 factor, ECF subfamily